MILLDVMCAREVCLSLFESNAGPMLMSVVSVLGNRLDDIHRFHVSISEVRSQVSLGSVHCSPAQSTLARRY
jgi:hypothetical protein